MSNKKNNNKMPELRSTSEKIKGDRKNEILEFLASVATFFLFIAVVYLYLLVFGAP